MTPGLLVVSFDQHVAGVGLDQQDGEHEGDDDPVDQLYYEDDWCEYAL